MTSRTVRRSLAAVLALFVLAVLLAGTAAPTYADTEQDCAAQGFAAEDDPACAEFLSTDEAPEVSSSIPGVFVALIVIGVIAAGLTTAWKVTTARRLARESGMDPDLATQMTLVTEGGLESTYLAANLRNQDPPEPAASVPEPAPAPAAQPVAPAARPASGAATPTGAPVAPTTRGAAQRLVELKGLLDGGLITQAEYDERRQAIIDGV